MIVKLSSSGKQLQVVCDDGSVFVTSVAFLLRLVDGSLRSPFIVCSLLPNKASVDRFPKSPVYNPGLGRVVVDSSKVSSDSFSKKSTSSVKVKRVFSDEEVL